MVSLGCWSGLKSRSTAITERANLGMQWLRSCRECLTEKHINLHLDCKMYMVSWHTIYQVLAYLSLKTLSFKYHQQSTEMKEQLIEPLNVKYSQIAHRVKQCQAWMPSGRCCLFQHRLQSPGKVSNSHPAAASPVGRWLSQGQHFFFCFILLHILDMIFLCSPNQPYTHNLFDSTVQELRL